MEIKEVNNILKDIWFLGFKDIKEAWGKRQYKIKSNFSNKSLNINISNREKPRLEDNFNNIKIIRYKKTKKKYI